MNTPEEKAAVLLDALYSFMARVGIYGHGAQRVVLQRLDQELAQYDKSHHPDLVVEGASMTARLPRKVQKLVFGERWNHRPVWRQTRRSWRFQRRYSRFINRLIERW